MTNKIAFIFMSLLMLSFSLSAFQYVNNQTLAVVVYLQNSQTNATISYPKFSSGVNPPYGTYRCVVDALPADNNTIDTVTWTTITAPGVNISGQVGTSGADGQAWYSQPFTPSGSGQGTITCDVNVYGSDGWNSLNQRSFVITQPLPGCNDTNECDVTAAQTIPYQESGFYSSYYIINVTAAGSLAAGHDSYGDTIGPVSLEGDSALDIAGTVGMTGNTGTASNCPGGGGGSLYLYSRFINISGTVDVAGGNGYTSCTSGYSPGGNAYNVYMYYDTLLNTGTIEQKGGNGGTPTIAGGYGQGGTANGINFYGRSLTSSGTITVDGGNGENQPTLSGSCNNMGSTAGAGGNSWCIDIEGAGGANAQLANFSGGTVTCTGGAGGSGSGSGFLYGAGSQCGGTGGVMEGPSGKSYINSEVFINAATWTLTGGAGGAACEYSDGSGSGNGKAGNGGWVEGYAINDPYSIDVTAGLTLTSGAGGAAGPTETICPSGGGSATPPAGAAGVYFYNFTAVVGSQVAGNSFSNFHPNIVNTTQNQTAYPIGSLNFTSPTYNSNVSIIPTPTTISWNLSNAAYGVRVEWSLDNKTWTTISGIDYPLIGMQADSEWGNTEVVENATNVSFNRMPVTFYVRAAERNMSNSLRGNWTYTYFTTQNTNVSFTSFRSPNSSSVTATIMNYYCVPNRTTIDNNTVQNAIVAVVLNNVTYQTTYVPASDWYTLQTASPTPGNQTWYCTFSKPNYYSQQTANNTFTYSGVLVSLPTGVTSVRMLCPFPIYAGVTPWGQTYGKPIFFITNTNVNASNVTISIYPMIPNVNIYARLNWVGIADIYAHNTVTGWPGTPVNSTLVTTTPTQIYTNLASGGNLSVWLHANCMNDTNATSFNVTYLVGGE